MSATISSLFADNIPDVSPVEPKPAGPPPRAELWFNLTQKPTEDDSELIKGRFLCRGGGLLVVGQTGVGKSSFSRQMALHFAMGKPFLGMQPVRAMRVLIIQAENDDHDEAEMCRGITSGSKFEPDEVAPAGDLIFHYREQSRCGLKFFSDTVEPLIEQVRPDLLLIDPLLAYLGGDQNSQQDVGGWLRNCLNPLLTKHKCAAMLVHHTAKLTKKNLKDNWGAGDFGYLGAGSAEFANWSRAILCLVPTAVPGIYELNAPKRGTRLGWTERDGGKITTKKMIKHSQQAGEICWYEAMGEEVSFVRDGNGKPIPTTDDFLSIFPALEANTDPKKCLLTAGEIRNLFAKRGWKRDSYAGVCDQAVKEGKVKFLQEGRGNRTKRYGRPEAISAYEERRATETEPGA